MPKYDLAFVILTWNSEGYIAKCLQSINTINSFDVKVYVIENGSRDKTSQVLQRLQKELRHINLEIIPLSENKGTTVSRNIGLRKAYQEAKYICILDSDTVINENAIQYMIDVLEKNSQIGIVGPMLKGLDGAIQNSGRGIPTVVLKALKVLPIKRLKQKGESLEKIPKNTDITQVGYLMSACWLLPSSLIEKIGFLDENIFYAPEDVEYCLRAWQEGYQVVYAKKVSIIHAWQRLSRKKLFSKHNWEHIKGLIYLFHKYHCYFQKPAYVHYEN